MKFDENNLPSRGIPYAVKSIEVSPLRPKHMPLLSEAIHTDNSAPLIQAVGQVMDFDVNHLTDGDFYYILTWLRFASRNLPLFAEWDCLGTMFRRKDTDKLYTVFEIDDMYQQWDQAENSEAREHMENPNEIEFLEQDCEQHNKEIVTFDDFSTRLLNPEPLPEGLDYPRVRNLVEYLDLLRESRYVEIVGPVRYIKEGNTLRSKIAMIEETDDMDMFDKAAKAHFTHDHGILQRVNKRCSKCGMDHPFNVTIDAASFFV